MNDETLSRERVTEPRTAQYFDPLAVMVGEFARDFVEPTARIDAIDRLYSMLNEARSEAAQGKETRAAQRLIPDVLKGVGHRDEHGNLIEDYHMCGCRQVPIEAQPEVAQEAAPLHGHNYGGDWIECTEQHEGAAPRACNCNAEMYGDGTRHSDDCATGLGAAPRAEGLDTDALARLLKARYGDAAFGAAVGTLSLERFQMDAEAITADLARLSRPSDEESDTARSCCERFRHDEHCAEDHWNG